MCTVIGCSNKSVKPEEISATFERRGLGEIPDVGNFVGNFDICAAHAAQFAEAGARNLERRYHKRVTPVLDIPPIEPQAHYDTSLNGRRRRLVEIEESLNEPTLEERQERARRHELERMRRDVEEIEELQRKNAPVSDRFQMHEYLRRLGADPSRFNF